MGKLKKRFSSKTFWPEIICVAALIAFGYFVYSAFSESKTHPTVNKIVRNGNVYELSDTLLLCSEVYRPNRQHFSIHKNDSLAALKPDDICIHCGNKLSSHHTSEMWLVEQISESGDYTR